MGKVHIPIFAGGMIYGPFKFNIIIMNIICKIILLYIFMYLCTIIKIVNIS